MIRLLRPRPLPLMYLFQFVESLFARAAAFIGDSARSRSIVRMRRRGVLPGLKPRRCTSLFLIFGAVVAMGACTPGAPSNPSAGNAQISSAIIVHVSLLKYPPVSSPYGTLAAFSPNPLTVTHGAVVQFVNDDNFNHTATSVGTTGFVSSPLSSSAQSASGSDLANPGWSTGALMGGGFSQGFSTSTPGTYYFQCFYHYTQMHGVIIVQ